MLIGAHTTPLIVWLDEFCGIRQLTPAVRQQYKAAVESLELATGRTVTLGDLHEPLLSSWLQADASEAKTKRNRLAAILAIWRGAAAAFPDLPLPVAARLPRFRWTKPLPDAWSLDEMARLFHACQNYTPRIKHGPWIGRTYGTYFELLTRLAYDTGLRRGDLHALTMDDISGQAAELTQRKTGKRHRVALSPQTVHLIQLSPGHRGPLLPRLPNHTHARHWRRLLARAGLPAGRRCGLQKIRRTSATQIELNHPGAAGQHLGHSTPGLAARHYLDASQLGQNPRLPPQPADKSALQNE